MLDSLCLFNSRSRLLFLSSALLRFHLLSVHLPPLQTGNSTSFFPSSFLLPCPPLPNPSGSRSSFYTQHPSFVTLSFLFITSSQRVFPNIMSQPQYGYPPPQQSYGVPPPQQPYYQTQPQPYYQPQNQQQQWGLQQAPQQQQYFGQPMTGVMPPSYDGTINPETGLPAKFNPKPKYNDLWAFILFLVQLAAFVVLSYFAIRQVKNDNKTGTAVGPTLGIFSSSGLISLCISIGVGAVVSVLYFILIQAFPRQIIKVPTSLSLSLACFNLLFNELSRFMC